MVKRCSLAPQHHFNYYLLIIILYYSSSSFAAPYYGANFSYAAVTKEPPSLNGYQIMLTYDPQSIQWREINLYFDGGFTHLWITNQPYYTAVSIYSIAPVARFTLYQRGFVSTYLDLSIGASYLNHTHLDSRNLGIHYAFQDRIGLGLLIGQKQQVTIGFHAIHYSNARLSQHNSGITVPLMLDIGYRFQ